jgi:hypothetical protein
MNVTMNTHDLHICHNKEPTNKILVILKLLCLFRRKIIIFSDVAEDEEEEDNELMNDKVLMSSDHLSKKNRSNHQSPAALTQVLTTTIDSPKVSDNGGYQIHFIDRS